MDVSQYIGIPFKNHGRSVKEGLDCWGLVRLVMMEQFGIFLPSLVERYPTLHAEHTAPLIKDMLSELPLVRVDSPEPGDIVLMKFLGHPTHVGILVSERDLLHTDPVGRGTSRLERLDSHRIAPTVEGYYRVR